MHFQNDQSEIYLVVIARGTIGVDWVLQPSLAAATGSTGMYD